MALTDSERSAWFARYLDLMAEVCPAHVGREGPGAELLNASVLLTQLVLDLAPDPIIAIRQIREAVRELPDVDGL